MIHISLFSFEARKFKLSQKVFVLVKYVHATRPFVQTELLCPLCLASRNTSASSISMTAFQMVAYETKVFKLASMLL